MRMFGQRRWTIAALMMVALLAAGLLAGCSEKKAPPARAVTVPVSVATAVKKEVPLQITAIGTVESQNSVQIKSMINGEITSVRFKEGQDVKKGELLFTIDKRPGEADLRRAEATLAKDMASASQARADANRYAALYKEGVVAEQQASNMKAAAEASEQLVSADRAAVENAKVQLTYTNIYAPITGRTGNLTIQLGNVLKANDVPIVSVNQIDPIYVTFTIPEQLLPQVKQYMAQHKLSVSAAIPNDPRPAVGTLTFVDNAVDRQTGTIKLKGTFSNTDRRLWPGQFVNVSLTLTTEPNAIVIPTVAVQSGQQGPFIFVVTNDGTAESRLVKVDRAVGDQSVIQSGVQPGDIVVTDGQLRLTPGAKVDVKNNGGQGQSQNADERTGPRSIGAVRTPMAERQGTIS